MSDFQWRNVNTLYNGRCRQFKYYQELETGTYMTFFVKQDAHPIDIFILNAGKIGRSLEMHYLTQIYEQEKKASSFGKTGDLHL